nr:hypothetical protein [Nitrosomonas nitrosa]
MALDRTSGFDMLVQISESEINDQLETLFLMGGLIPPSMVLPVNTGPVQGTANIIFNTPVADLDRPRPRMGLTLPFANSEFVVTSPVALTLSPLGGRIEIVDALDVIVQGSSQIVALDFNSGAPTVTVTFNADSVAILTPVLTAAGLTLAAVQNLVAGTVLTQLQSGSGRIDLTPPIPVVDDTDPTTIFDIDVTTINDTSVADRDCVAFGVRMASDSGGNINLVTTNFIPAGSQSLVMMSNFWLLARVMRPRVASALGRSETDFDTPLRLNRNIPAPGGQGTLTRLEARVEGNRIRVDGRATASDTGWSAVADFTFFIDIALSGGSITVTATTPTVNTDVDLEWWVWLLSLGLGALFGGIIGVIVAAIVLAVVEAVAEGIVNNLISGGIGGALGGIPSIPLGPIGSGLSLDAVILDDLELRSAITRSLTVPVKAQGAHTSLVGFSVDLDTGVVSAGESSVSDLTWRPSNSLRAAGPARLTTTGASYGSLTPVKVSRMPLNGALISAGAIPASFPPSFPFVSHSALVFGMRTAEGRFAKVKAWYDVTTGGALHLDWVTWDTPVPELAIRSHWSVIERGEVTESITPDCQFCKSAPVRWCGLFEAVPKLMPFPIDSQWCLCGTVIAEGEGQVHTSSGPLDYQLKGRRLIVRSQTLGEDIHCQLCISAIDARGFEHYKCIRLDQPGIEKICRKCVPTKAHYEVALVATKQELAHWRPLLSSATPEKVSA